MGVSVCRQCGREADVLEIVVIERNYQYGFCTMSCLETFNLSKEIYPAWNGATTSVKDAARNAWMR